MMQARFTIVLACLAFSSAGAVETAQIDKERAEQYFKEARALCEREGGRLWGVSLCGPIVIGDPATRSLVTSQAQPAVKPPLTIFFANAAIDWGGTRWTTLSWPTIPHENEQLRARLIIHELFHRVQPQLGLLGPDGDNAHLDTEDGRYWIQLEWRALAKALASDREAADRALRDALAFRQTRWAAFPGAAAAERRMEINEGLAQYTGTVVAAGSSDAAERDAIEQLAAAEKSETFVRTFPYAAGAAYGLLLDRRAPEWRRRIEVEDDLAQLLAGAAKLSAASDVDAAAERYGGSSLRASERVREQERVRRVRDLHARFVEGPVVVFPRSRNNSFRTAGMTPIPGEGTVYPSFRSTAEWGTLEADQALLKTDRTTIRVPGPAKVDGAALRGPGWTARLADGWTARRGEREGDLIIVKVQQR